VFPDCTTCLRCIQDGRVIYRICNNPTGPHYRTCIGAVVCLQCTIRSTVSPAQPAPPPRPEPPKLPEPPSLAQRVMSYAEAVARWIAAGRPERSDKEVEEIFNTDCKPCKWFDRERQICRGCGCRVTDDGFAVLNKIKMATEHCPRELW
jgi:hypothetical protein